MKSERQPQPPDHDEAVETAAAGWLCERDEGFGPGRESAFAAWRAERPEHDRAARRMEQSLELLSSLPEIRVPLEARLATAEAGGNRPPAFWRGIVAFGTSFSGVAAVLAIAAVLWWAWPRLSDGSERFETTADRQRRVALSDGSVLDLNVGSEVRVRLVASERRATVLTGEAHFSVAHDEKRPFVVTAGGVSVRAVGTAFSVGLVDGKVEVLVSEGRVAVSHVEQSAGDDAPLAADKPLLLAGERTVIAPGKPTAPPAVERLSGEALLQATRWHSQIMTFSDMPLREAIQAFNRRNVVQVALADRELGERRVGGSFAADQVEAFVRLLESQGEVLSERRGSLEIVLRRAP